MFIFIIHFILLIHMNLSEPFHVTNQIRKGEVLSSYLLAVYLDGLFLELNNLKSG